MIKVLIICAGLQFGGVERFSANICKYAPKGEFQFDYLIFEGLGDAYVPEIKENGGKVITIPSPSQGYKAYIKRLGEILDNNHYDVVHSHTQFNSGINMWVAKKHGVKIRISHSHTTAHENKISFKQKIYEEFMRKLIIKYSTHRCACGVDAGKWMYGNKPFTVINNGIDTDLFKFSPENRKKIRQQYEIDDNTLVIGHSGTLSKLKNQEFLIRILPGNTILMCLGRGEEEFEEYLKSVAVECGVKKRVIFTGAVTNVNEYLSAFDVFAFPSLREGTPIALLEAQANGLPCIISDAIPKDAQITDLVKVLPLNIDVWKTEFQRSMLPDSSARSNVTKEIEIAGFGMRSSLQPLYDMYRKANG